MLSDPESTTPPPAAGHDAGADPFASALASLTRPNNRARIVAAGHATASWVRARRATWEEEDRQAEEAAAEKAALQKAAEEEQRVAALAALNTARSDSSRSDDSLFRGFGDGAESD